MRRVVSLAMLVTLGAVAACSLFVDAGELSGGGEPGADAAADVAAPGPGDAGGPDRASPDGGADAADPLRVGLVGEWLFDEVGASIAADTSGKGRPARFAGAARIAAGGVRGGALTLGGGADRAIVDALEGAAFPKEGTLSLRARYTFNPSDGQNRAIFDDWDDRRLHLFLRRANDGAPKSIQFAIQAPSGYAFVTERDLEPSTWAHYVLTWSAQEAAYYADDREVRRGPYDRAFGTAGQRFVLGANWVGQIDEVKLWDRVLSALEVAVLD